MKEKEYIYVTNRIRISLMLESARQLMSDDILTHADKVALIRRLTRLEDALFKAIGDNIK